MNNARRISLLLAGSAALCMSAVGSAQAGDLAKLKIYRNYYTINLQSPSAHQIEVWYQTKDQFGFDQWSWDNIGIQQDQDLTQLTKEDFVSIPVFIAGWPQLPEQFETIPAVLEPKRNDIEVAFRRIFADKTLTNITLVYRGYKALLDVNEYVPLQLMERTENSDPAWIGQESSRTYFVDFATNQLESIASSGSGFGILFYGYTAEQADALKWFDFDVPSSVVGSSILSLNWEHLSKHANQTHLDSYQKLLAQIVDAATLLQAGTAVNTPLETILAKQGETLLPESLKQYFDLEISGYGRTKEGSSTEQLDVSVEFLLPLQDGAFSLTQIHSESGFTFSVTGNLMGPTPSIQVSVLSGNGLAASISGTVDLAKTTYVRSSNNVMASSITWNWEKEGEFSLPGMGEYTSFDFYLRDYILPLQLTGIEAK